MIAAQCQDRAIAGGDRPHRGQAAEIRPERGEAATGELGIFFFFATPGAQPVRAPSAPRRAG
ncbi:hypothetical protein [Sorangium sp. So ce854]|uniref:hypothetical protein n=1 Tax=Sorangium sp. So ce854 TaxID=3133322 RepID=UPI003F61D5E8